MAGRFEAVNLDSLDAYIFPVEESEGEKLRRCSSRPQKRSVMSLANEVMNSRMGECVDNKEDGGEKPIYSTYFPNLKKESLMEHTQPFFKRRGAVVGESVSPDPGYWYCSSARKLREGEGSCENCLPEDIRRIIRGKILAHHPLFSKYSPFIQKLFEDAFVMRSYRSGEVVVKEADSSPFCYVVRGSVELLTEQEREENELKKKGIYSSTSQQRSVKSGMVHPMAPHPPPKECHERKRVKRREGEDFGQEGLLHFLFGERFGYTAVALVPSLVLHFSREVYKKILMVHFLESHEILVNIINHVHVFAGFSDAERSHISRAVKSMSFCRGDVLLPAGSSPQNLMIIEEGVVEVVRPMGTLPCKLPVQVKLLMPTECVGDAEIFSWDFFSPYDYVAYSAEVKVLYLDEGYFYKYHGHPLLQHLFKKINVKDMETRKELVQSLRHQVDAQRVVDLSSDDERDEANVRRIGEKCGPSTRLLSSIPMQYVPKQVDTLQEIKMEGGRDEMNDKLPEVAVEGSRGCAAVRLENEGIENTTNHMQNKNGTVEENPWKKQEIAVYFPSGELSKHERLSGDLTTEDEEEEEDIYAPSVNIKAPEITDFLLENFFERRAYCGCHFSECGTALTAFTSPRPLRPGTVLFSAEPLTLPGESEAVVKARRLRRRKDNPHLDFPRQYLYVVYKGAIELLDRDGEQIALITAGGSVGEHRLLKSKTGVCDVTARVVCTGAEGCQVIRLARHIYRHNLLRGFVEAYEAFRDLFSCLPFAQDIPPSHLLVLYQYMDFITLGPASVILAEDVHPREVFVILDGSVSIRFRGGGMNQNSSGGDENVEVFHAQRGDGIGALELMDNVKARAAYITEGRVGVFRIPASQFFSVLRLVIPYFESLRHTTRFRQLYGSARKVLP